MLILQELYFKQLFNQKVDQWYWKDDEIFTELLDELQNADNQEEVESVLSILYQLHQNY